VKIWNVFSDWAGFGTCKEPLPHYSYTTFVLCFLWGSWGRERQRRLTLLIPPWLTFSLSRTWFLSRLFVVLCFPFNPMQDGWWGGSRRVYLVSHSVLVKWKARVVTSSCCSLYSGPHLLSWRALWDCNLESQQSSPGEECDKRYEHTPPHPGGGIEWAPLPLQLSLVLLNCLSWSEFLSLALALEPLLCLWEGLEALWLPHWIKGSVTATPEWGCVTAQPDWRLCDCPT
jgi:hypothetical protein